MVRESAQVLRNTRQRAVAVISDGDRTLWKSNAAEWGIGKPYIMQALRTGRFATAWRGVIGYLEIKRAIRKDPTIEVDGAKGLEMFYSKLRRSGIGKSIEMQGMAYEYIIGHRLRSTFEIVTYFDRKFLASCNGSSVAAAANRVFNFTNFVSNQDLFDRNGLLTGLDVRIRDGEDKARCVFDMLVRHGISLMDCIYIGDNSSDIPALKMARFPVASPFATEEVKAVAHFVLSDKTLMV